MTDDGKVALIVNPNGLTATVYRLHIDTGERQLVRTLEMRDPTGGFGITRIAATPDGSILRLQYLARPLGALPAPGTKMMTVKALVIPTGAGAKATAQ